MAGVEAQTKNPSQYLKWAGVVLGALMMIPLIVHAYLGGFSRYIADDYCTLGTLKNLGFLGSQLNWYNQWSGRYSFTFMVNLTQLAGPKLTPWLPALAVALWVLSVLCLFLQWQRWFEAPRSIILAFAPSTLVVFTTLHGSPNVYQSLYWQTGMLTYSLPLILLTAYMAWLLFVNDGLPDNNRMAWAIPVSGIAAFVFGGFSETYVSVQTALLIVLLILSSLTLRGRKRQQLNAVLGAGVFGSILAMAVIVLAPGTAVRRSLMLPSPDIYLLITKSIKDVYIFSVITLRRQPFIVLLSVTLPALVGLLTFPDYRARKPVQKGDWIRWFLPLYVIPIITAVMILASIMPSEYAISSYPDGRVLIMPVYFLFLGLILWGLTLGYRLRSLIETQKAGTLLAVRLIFGLAVCALGVFGIISARALTGEIPTARQYSQEWDKRDQTLKTHSGDQDDPIAIPSLRHMGQLAEIDYSPDYWVNRCVAQAYGVGAVIAK